MDELIKSVTAKAGVSEEQAKKAVQSVVEFLKAKFPAIGGQLESLMQGGGGGLGDIAGKIGGMLGGKS